MLPECLQQQHGQHLHMLLAAIVQSAESYKSESKQGDASNTHDVSYNKQSHTGQRASKETLRICTMCRTMSRVVQVRELGRRRTPTTEV
jgi:hypothetical protein